MRYALAGILVGGLMLVPVPGMAQNVGARVFIDAAPIGSNALRNLGFGTRTPGETVDVGAGSATNLASAAWQFTGLPKNATITLDFTAAPLSNGTTSMSPIYDNAGYGSWCTRRTGTACGDPNTNSGAFNPGDMTATASTLGTSVVGNNDRILDVWVGARLTIPDNASSGDYTGTLSLTITVN